MSLECHQFHKQVAHKNCSQIWSAVRQNHEHDSNETLLFDPSWPHSPSSTNSEADLSENLGQAVIDAGIQSIGD